MIFKATMPNMNCNKVSLSFYAQLLLQFGFVLGCVRDDLLPQCLHLISGCPHKNSFTRVKTVVAVSSSNRLVPRPPQPSLGFIFRSSRGNPTLKKIKLLKSYAIGKLRSRSQLSLTKFSFLRYICSLTVVVGVFFFIRLGKGK